MPHVKLGLDLLDIATSPNDPGLFSGHHANVDRSNMVWQQSTATQLQSNYWFYPKANSDLTAAGQSKITVSGPYPLHDF